MYYLFEVLFLIQISELDLSKCVPPVNSYIYTVYSTSNPLKVIEGVKLYNQTTLTISDIEQGEKYIITIIAVSDVGESQPAITAASELEILVNFPVVMYMF